MSPDAVEKHDFDKSNNRGDGPNIDDGEGLDIALFEEPFVYIKSAFELQTLG